MGGGGGAEPPLGGGEGPGGGSGEGWKGGPLPLALLEGEVIAPIVSPPGGARGLSRPEEEEEEDGGGVRPVPPPSPRGAAGWVPPGGWWRCKGGAPPGNSCAGTCRAKPSRPFPGASAALPRRGGGARGCWDTGSPPRRCGGGGQEVAPGRVSLPPSPCSNGDLHLAARRAAGAPGEDGGKTGKNGEKRGTTHGKGSRRVWGGSWCPLVTRKARGGGGQGAVGRGQPLSSGMGRPSLPAPGVAGWKRAWVSLRGAQQILVLVKYRSWRWKRLGLYLGCHRGQQYFFFFF